MPTTAVETLRWNGDRLELIDQRRLPMAFEYVACREAAEVADAIRTMVVRGAPAIGCAAAYGVALEALRHAQVARPALDAALERAFTRLGASRPTAVNLFWALARMRGLIEALGRQASPARVAERLLAEAHAIRDEDIAANRRMGALGAELLPEAARVMTYCNAGALATAGHGTALGVIRSARESGKRPSVFACETRPFLQGARLTAWELVTEGIPATLIADNMAGFLMSRGEIDAVIVGADRVAANGDVANKIGTYPLAVLADRHAVPFYVACPLSTIDRAVASGAEIPIEERPPDEVTGYGGVRWAPPEIAVRNPAFDVTPAELVSVLITERGVVRSPGPETIAALFAF
ncbi:MAG: S-methyl-5-thioribose-1-phosphate isomerase [Pseudomonadota bacterium]